MRVLWQIIQVEAAFKESREVPFWKLSDTLYLPRLFEEIHPSKQIGSTLEVCALRSQAVQVPPCWVRTIILWEGQPDGTYADPHRREALRVQVLQARVHKCWQ